jgi:predicted negative regulator of RcsB-dependent stress response
LLKSIANSEEPDATLFDHLGDVYAAMKEPEKAREAWRKSVGIEPNEKVQKKLGESPSANKSAAPKPPSEGGTH